MNRDRQPDLVVIGGGIAGLASATFAAREGLQVMLLEGAAEVGGLARTTERDGFRLNLGPRALYPAAAHILAELGVPYTGSRPTLAGYVLAGGRLHPMPKGVKGLLDAPPSAGRHGPTAARALAELAQTRSSDASHLSLAEWAAKLDLEEGTRQRVFALVRLASYIDAPDLLSAEAAGVHLAETAADVRYLDGGWQTIVDGLAQVARAAGVQIQRRARVVGLRRDSSGVAAVALADGTNLSTRSVVLAVDPPVARAILAPAGAAVPPTTPVRAAVFDLALSRLPHAEADSSCRSIGRCTCPCTRSPLAWPQAPARSSTSHATCIQEKIRPPPMCVRSSSR